MHYKHVAYTQVYVNIKVKILHMVDNKLLHTYNLSFDNKAHRLFKNDGSIVSAKGVVPDNGFHNPA